jgi:hypothetical protein
MVLARVADMDEVSQRDRIRLVGLWEAQSRWCAGQGALTLAKACRDAEERADEAGVSPPRSLIAEAALVAGLTSYAAHMAARVGQAGLDEPAIGDALAAGVLGVSAGNAILRAAERLEDPANQRRVLAHGAALAAQGQSRPRIQEGCEQLATDLDPAGLSHAHEVAYLERSIRFRSRSAAMGVITVFGAAHELSRIIELVGAAARAGGPGDPRTADQRRYDAFVGCFLEQAAGAGGSPGADPVGGDETGSEGGANSRRRPPAGGRMPRCEVLVRMDATTLLGLDNRAGLILGVGPVPAEVGRAIAKDATWRGLFVDPASGRPVWQSERRFRAGMVFGAVSGQRAGAGPPQNGPEAGLEHACGTNGDQAHSGCCCGGEGGGSSPPGTGSESAMAAVGVNPWGEAKDWPMEVEANNAYSPGARLRRWLAVRQPTCANPACGRKHAGCEVDHIDPYDPSSPAEDQTVLANLQHLTKGCHELKTHFGWDYGRDPETGITTITTPLGFVYQRQPDRLA